MRPLTFLHACFFVLVCFPLYTKDWFPSLLFILVVFLFYLFLFQTGLGIAFEVFINAHLFSFGFCIHKAR